MHRVARLLGVIVALGLMVAACADDESLDGMSITVLTHDSFVISEEALAAFTAQTGISVSIQTLG
ncbi:MAG: thiamine ABC transporter substrate-binding protein, partial [Acidimicrobiaceae bacterium]|nr:thiamine ABC transporter substrate-binding protein [Acidimicrobiaceae bacterium]